MSVPAGIVAVAAMLAGVILFAVVSVGAIVFLADWHCGAAFGYYGCESPTANNRTEVDPVARAPEDGFRLGLRAPLGASSP
jgi:hypothetical protein